MDTPTQPLGSTNPQPQPLNSSGDARLDAIRAKKQRGETLDPKERGYLAYKNSVLAGKNQPGTGRSPGAAVVARQIVSQPQSTNPLLTTGGEVAAPSNVAVAPNVDPALVVKTVRTILNGVDRFTQRTVAIEARKAGADAAHQAEFVKAVELAPELRDTISETSPDALASLGVDTTQMPLMAFIGGLATYALTVGNAISGLRDLQRQRLEMEKELRKAKADAPNSKQV